MATTANPHDLQWFHANHPDWLMYSGEASRPITGGARNLWAIDIANPAVRSYMLQYVKDKISAATATGTDTYAYVAMDNVAALNANHVQGHYDGAKAGCGSEPAFCGRWRQRYSGSVADAAWADDIFDYARFFKTELNKLGIGLWLNAKLNRADVSQSIRLAAAGDAVLRESQFLHACTKEGNTNFVAGLKPGNDWFANLELMNELHDKQVIVSFNSLCNHPVSAATEPEIAYAVANYHLMRGNFTYFEMQNGTNVGGRDSDTLAAYPPSIFVDLGAPLEPPPRAGSPNSSGGCYQRAFERGLVVVWPSPIGSCSYTVPNDHHWTDQFGRAAPSGSQTLMPDSSVAPKRANAIVLYWTQ